MFLKYDFFRGKKWVTLSLGFKSIYDPLYGKLIDYSGQTFLIIYRTQTNIWQSLLSELHERKITSQFSIDET